MCSNGNASPWRLCPHCGAHGPGIAELGWLPVGVHHPGHLDLCGPGHVYTCRYCGQAWMGPARR
ncbi:MAG TPA: hypothetical protein VIR27_05865 [Mycobacteriales bacterium]|jgi:hypothetical protein